MRPVSATLSSVASASAVAVVIATPLACTVMAIAMTTGVCTYIGLVAYTALRACPRDPTREIPTTRTRSSYCYFRGLTLVAEETLTCQRTAAPTLILSRSHCPAGATSAPSVTAIGICLLTAREETIGATLESRNVAVGFFVADERHQHPAGTADDRSPQHAPGNHRPRTPGLLTWCESWCNVSA